MDLNFHGTVMDENNADVSENQMDAATAMTSSRSDFDSASMPVSHDAMTSSPSDFDYPKTPASSDSLTLFQSDFEFAAGASTPVNRSQL